MRIRFLNNDVLEAKADEFLKRYHPTRQLPIPIEDIIDVHMGIDIVPVNGLRRRFDVEAFTSTNLRTIFVDENEYAIAGNRFRFSLAHEAAHILVHDDFIRARTYRTVDEWMKAQNDLTDVEYNRLEHQANSVGGMILVPTDLLKHHYDRFCKDVRKEALFELELHEMRTMIEERLSRLFRVSTEVISRRLNDEGIHLAKPD